MDNWNFLVRVFGRPFFALFLGGGFVHYSVADKRRYIYENT